MLTVVAWKKWGHHRLYVNDEHGTRVGWLDLQTGTAVIEQVDRSADFESALGERGFAASSVELSRSEEHIDQVNPPADRVATQEDSWSGGIGDDPLPPLLLPEPPGTPQAEPAVPWVDLARNRPGEGVNKVAASERKSAPIRTRAARVVGRHNRERSFRIGEKGEVKVARALASLPNTWRTIHSVPVGSRGSDIDHVVIGPGGVFTVNAKNHPDARVWVKGDTVLVNGKNRPYVRKSRYEAKRAKSKLSEYCGLPIAVVGVVSLVGCHRGLEVRAQPSDGSAFVIARRDLAKWLCQHGEILDEGEVERIFEAARRSTTWQ
jgi:hypothetical protein